MRTLVRDSELFRIYQPFDPRTGAPREPWWFSTRGATGGLRFDLRPPHGSCYFSDHRCGAWLETFRDACVVDRRDVERRRLLVARRVGAELGVADLDAAGARKFGVTAELGSGADYALPQQWAAALHVAGWQGVSAAARHDPTHTARTLALFGRAGARSRVAGWHTHHRSLVAETRLWSELAPYGVTIAAVPYNVPVTRPGKRLES